MNITSTWLANVAKIHDKRERNGASKHTRILEYLEDTGFDNPVAWRDLEGIEQSNSDLNDKAQLKPGEYRAIRNAILRPHNPRHMEEKQSEILGRLEHLASKAMKNAPPVQTIPLIYPNNTRYDEQSGKLVPKPNTDRTGFVVNQHAIEFIRSIQEPVGVITINGKARTGKSLIASQLVAKNQTPSSFDLGHRGEACTLGIWMALRKIDRPQDSHVVDEKDAESCMSILVLDVEGTNFYGADQRSDYQLMVIALLICSLFVYNIKGTIDRSSLDEIQFVTQLTEKIGCPNSSYDDDTHSLSKFFPRFLWLLRDSHLEFVDADVSSLKEYFVQNILKTRPGRHNEWRQNAIRSAFQEYFPSFDAIDIPPPGLSDRDAFKYLGVVDLSEINQVFAEKVNEAADAILKQTPVKKVLVSAEKNATVACNGRMLADWIAMCVDQVNAGVPNVESIGQTIVKRQIDDAFRASCETYERRMCEVLNRGRQDLMRPLMSTFILACHQSVVNDILGEDGCGCHLVAVKEEGCVADYRLQCLERFYRFIGHHMMLEGNVESTDRTGILPNLLRENNDLCRRYCHEFIAKEYAVLEQMLERPRQWEVIEIESRFRDVEEAYRNLEIAGEEAHAEVWKEFCDVHWRGAYSSFLRCKEMDAKLIEEQTERQEMSRQLNDQRHRVQMLVKQQDQQRHAWSQERAEMRSEVKGLNRRHEEEMRRVEKKMRVVQHHNEQRLEELTAQHARNLDVVQKSAEAKRIALEKKVRAEQAAAQQRMQNQIAQLQRDYEKKLNPATCSFRSLVPSLPDSSFSASSYWDCNHTPNQGRINSTLTWCARNNGVGHSATRTTTVGTEYLTVDLGRTYQVVGVVTAGRNEHPWLQWVTKYRVETSLNGSSWSTVGTFDGNRDTITHQRRMFNSAVQASFVRFVVLEYKFHPSMTVDVLVI